MTEKYQKWPKNTKNDRKAIENYFDVTKNDRN